MRNFFAALFNRANQLIIVHSKKVAGGCFVLGVVAGLFV
jgi:hypothetical protein